jgi:tetratricopeptide (TPR) repeat protein
VFGLKALTVLQQQTIVVAKDANELVSKLHSNLGAVAVKQDQAEEAIEHCKLALAIDGTNVKALFRRAEGLKMLGRYQEALGQLEKALLVEENNEEIREAMDDCEDLIDLAGGDSMASLSIDPQEEDHGDPAAPELPEDVLVAVQAKIDELRSSIYMKGKEGKQNGGRLLQHQGDTEEEEEEGLVKEHIMLNHGDGKVGMVEIRDAFMSPSNLASATAFVRSQHFTATARYAFIIVQKSRMVYPHIWWAHPWPFPADMDKDGIFLEAHTRETHGTWFIPLEGSRQSHLVPQREILLDKECKLLDDDESIFP